MSQIYQRDQRRDMPYIPVNIRMIQEIMQRGKPYKIGEHLVDSVLLVARLTSFNTEGSGGIELTLEDDTGSINGKIFKRIDSGTIKPILSYNPTLNSYSSIIGNLTNFSGSDIIIITRMQNITQYSFVHMHRTQTCWAHKIRKRIIHMVSNENIINNLASKFIEAADDGDAQQFTQNQKKVMDFIKGKTDYGAERAEIMESVGLEKEVVKEVLEQLVEYGYLITNPECDFYRIS